MRAIAAIIAALGLAGGILAVTSSQAASNLPVRAHVLQLAADSAAGPATPTPTITPTRSATSTPTPTPTNTPSDPANATAKCKDGTYSYSQHAAGTCSGHGGVDYWINHPAT